MLRTLGGCQRFWQILIGASKGTSAFHEHEPPEAGAGYVIFPELIGFRAAVSAFPKSSTTL